jgi:hypothetical protein
MLQASKRLTADVFREPEGEAGTSAADATQTEATASYRGEITASTINATSPETFSTDRVRSTCQDRRGGLEL